MVKNFVFGYGSLISEDSRKKTGSTRKSIAAKLFGYRREWNAQIKKEKATFLGLAKNKRSYCNGVIFEASEKVLKKLDKREIGYKRIKVDNSKIKILGNKNQKIPKGNIYVYLTKNPKKPGKNFPILLSYLNVVINGCLDFGENFLKEFLETTYSWSYIKDDSNNHRYIRALRTNNKKKKLLNNQEFNKLKGGWS